MEKVKGDTEFSAWARELQNAWRVKNDIPIGTYKQKQKGGSYKEVELGNYIEKTFALDKQKNFLTDNICSVTTHVLKQRRREPKFQRHDFIQIYFQVSHWLLIYSVSSPLNITFRWRQNSFANNFQTE